MKKYLACGILLLAIFLYARVYKITDTLEFMADIGRDHYVLWQWKNTGKVPLLGPSTSVLPINQSPIYFYLLYPFYVLSNQSAFSSVMAVDFYYCLSFLCCMYVLRKYSYRWRFLVVVLLICIHPQFILQTRNPWNPSFILPFFLPALLFLMEPLRQKKIAPAIVALGCAISVGLSYSMLPASVVLFGVSVYLWRKKFVEVFGFFASSFLVVFLPILFFEVRHNFFFIHRLFLGATLNAGKSFGILDNLKELATILLGSNIQGFHFVFFALIALGLWKKRSMFLPILLMVGTWVATALSPTQIPPHYAFGVLTLFLFVLTILPKKILLVAVLLCIYLWSRPVWRQLYAAPIRRTISQLESCTRMICSSEKSPFFVTQNSWYLYHYATEYLYFLNKNGCNAYDITTDPGKAEKMLVIADNNEFTFGKTAFNELTLFGSAKLEGEYSCSGNIKAYVLTK